LVDELREAERRVAAEREQKAHGSRRGPERRPRVAPEHERGERQHQRQHARVGYKLHVKGRPRVACGEPAAVAAAQHVRREEGQREASRQREGVEEFVRRPCADASAEQLEGRQELDGGEQHAGRDEGERAKVSRARPRVRERQRERVSDDEQERVAERLRVPREGLQRDEDGDERAQPTPALAPVAFERPEQPGQRRRRLHDVDVRELRDEEAAPLPHEARHHRADKVRARAPRVEVCARAGQRVGGEHRQVSGDRRREDEVEPVERKEQPALRRRVQRHARENVWVPEREAARERDACGGDAQRHVEEHPVFGAEDYLAPRRGQEVEERRQREGERGP